MDEETSVSCDDTSNDVDFMYCLESFPKKKSKEKNGTCVPMCADLAKFFEVTWRNKNSCNIAVIQIIFQRHLCACYFHLRKGSFKLFKRRLPGFLTILTL